MVHVMSFFFFSILRSARLAALGVFLTALVAALFGGCGPVECVREVRCLDKCGGSIIVQDGCDPCPAGSVDRDTCTDGGAGGGG
jgi:hypothetical protein